jgi:hypothetical protein
MIGVSSFHGVFQMGTQPIPDSNAKPAPVLSDTPRIGPIMWVLLAGFLLPPTLVTWLGNQMGGIPHQTLWVVLLCLPGVLMLLSLPRTYKLTPDKLIIAGLFYKLRIPLDSIVAVRPVGTARALMNPGSIFCSDPSRAILIERRGHFLLFISPSKPEAFLAALAPAEPDQDPEP